MDYLPNNAFVLLKALLDALNLDKKQKQAPTLLNSLLFNAYDNNTITLMMCW